jgi:hypothetical protein
MKRGRGCECITRKSASLQLVHVAVIHQDLALLLSHLTQLKDEDGKDLREGTLGTQQESKVRQGKAVVTRLLRGNLRTPPLPGEGRA